MPYNTNSSRKSTYDIPSTSFQNVDYTTNIPIPLYTNTDQSSPSISQTFSSVIKKIQNKLNVLETDFIVNKKYFIDNFYSNHNFEKRSWFFKTFLKKDMKNKNIFYNSLHYINFNFVL
jgi:hypothetical protein